MNVDVASYSPLQITEHDSQTSISKRSPNSDTRYTTYLGSDGPLPCPRPVERIFRVAKIPIDDIWVLVGPLARVLLLPRLFSLAGPDCGFGLGLGPHPRVRSQRYRCAPKVEFRMRSLLVRRVKRRGLRHRHRRGHQGKNEDLACCEVGMSFTDTDRSLSCPESRLTRAPREHNWGSADGCIYR